MSLNIDIKFLGMVSSRFRNFKRMGNHLWNCSCPLCGDSKKDKLKARGYFYIFKNDLWFKCWNCNEAMPFSIFLWKIDKDMHKEYSFENFNETKRDRVVVDNDPIDIGSKPKFKKENILDDLKSIKSLSKEHPARKYVKKRMIPDKMFSKLFLVDKFMTWTNKLVPGKFSEAALKHDSPRLIIPFYDIEGNVFAYTGRAFDPKDKKKYILIKVDKSRPSIYGLERVNSKERVYVFEGPLNSMFIENSVAMAGISGCGIDDIFENFVIILDNDRRNKHIGKQIKKLINMGKNVCLWDNSIPENADINDLILSGWTSDSIKELINRCTYHGLEAQLEFNKWKKY